MADNACQWAARIQDEMRWRWMIYASSLKSSGADCAYFTFADESKKHFRVTVQTVESIGDNE